MKKKQFYTYKKCQKGDASDIVKKKCFWTTLMKIDSLRNSNQICVSKKFFFTNLTFWYTEKIVFMYERNYFAEMAIYALCCLSRRNAVAAKCGYCHLSEII